MPNLLDTILQDFRTSKRKVNRYLGYGIAFTLICFFYVVIPYFQYKGQQKSAQQAALYLKEELQVLNEHLIQIKKLNNDAENALTDIQSQINALPEHLHGVVLPEISEIINPDSSDTQQVQQVQSPGSSGEIYIPPAITDFNEAANWYIRNWFKELVDQLKRT